MFNVFYLLCLVYDLPVGVVFVCDWIVVSVLLCVCVCLFVWVRLDCCCLFGLFILGLWCVCELVLPWGVGWLLLRFDLLGFARLVVSLLFVCCVVGGLRLLSFG